MANTLSMYFTDEFVVEQFRSFFDDDIDFKVLFNLIEDNGDCFELNFNGRCFNIDYITGSVSEVNV